jgi:hypothetical protein
MRRNELHDESSLCTFARDARRKARFPAVLTTHCQALPIFPNSRQIFPPTKSGDVKGTRTTLRIAKCGCPEICCEPLVAALARHPAEAARGIVSIGKKTEGRASRGPV